jgi:hypothetical protein
MEILKYLDVLIGLAVVMVVLSPLVAGITQAILGVSSARSGHLQVALKNLILLLNKPVVDQTGVVPAGTPELSEVDAKSLARSVLVHPMIGKPPIWPFAWPTFWPFSARRGDVVEREELIRILLEFARVPGTDEAKQRLKQLLAANGIANPDQTLTAVRNEAQALELDDSSTAGHERLSKAILTVARGAFTGKINYWFDQIMARTTSEYRFRAQMITILAAALVASLVQLDSIDLLKRLSVDDKLRDSLVKQAQEQESRMEQQAAAAPNQGNADELEVARARRDEIESNLAKLQEPQLGVLPDHFIWQPLPRARLMRNPGWSVPYSRRLELVVGASVYPIEPLWTADPLVDIESAIRNSNAPVALHWEKHQQAVVHGPGVETLQVTSRKLNGATHVTGPVQAKVVSETVSGSFFLLAGYDAPVPVQAGPGKNLKVAIEGSAAAVSTRYWPLLTATNSGARWIQLRSRADDATTNILQPAGFFGSTAYFDDRLFAKAKECTAASHDIDCSVDAAVAQLNSQHFQAVAESTDFLVITSQRLGALQLRSMPGRAESNILNAASEFSCDSLLCFDSDLFNRTWRGVVLTWVLLSLGAPFWYDSLKDMLKLRSSLAQTEETARKGRQTST